MSHLRSEKARTRRTTLFEQRKLEVQITFENAYLDRRKGELIEKLTPAQIHQKISNQLEAGQQNLIEKPTACDGLVAG